MVFYSENIEDMDFYFTNNETNENPIDLGLTDLVSYSVNTQHSIEHVKVIYDLKKNNCLIDAKLSNKILLTEVSPKLINQLAYLIKRMLDDCLMIYQKNFLTKMIFETDLDVLGVVYDTVKVSCFIKTNNLPVSVTSWQILKNALEKSIQAERAEIIERPATLLILNLKRKKLRNFTIIYDFAKDSNVFQLPFSTILTDALRGLIERYCNFKGTHEVSLYLQFDLLQRNTLQIKKGRLYPSRKIRELSIPETKFIISQVNQMMSLVSNAKISSFELSRQRDGTYGSNFEVINDEHPSKKHSNMFCVDYFTSCELAQTFQRVLDKYSLPKLYREWINTVAVNISVKSGKWIDTFKYYKLQHQFDKDENAVDHAKHLVNIANKEIRNYGKICDFDVVTHHGTLTEIELLVNDINKLNYRPFKPMKLPLDALLTIEPKVYYQFRLSPNGYYLLSERYLGWSKL